MQRLLKLCERISDKKLKESVEEVLSSAKPHHPEFAMKSAIEECPSAPDSRQSREGGLIEHTVSVTELCEAIAKSLIKSYKIAVNLDHLIAAAILHDIYKTVEFGREGYKCKICGFVYAEGGGQPKWGDVAKEFRCPQCLAPKSAFEKNYVVEEVYLNHLELMVAELYRRKFPKEVIHIVASHFGTGSATPPRTYEALILHHADTFESIIAANVEQMRKMQEQMMESLRGSLSGK